MPENIGNPHSRNRSLDPPPQFPRNAHGLTYGSLTEATTPDNGPDLVAVYATNGRNGYAKRTDLEPEEPANPQEAQATQQARAQQGPKAVPVYEVDGKTVIGVFVMDSHSA